MDTPPSTHTHALVPTEGRDGLPWAKDRSRVAPPVLTVEALAELYLERLAASDSPSIRTETAKVRRHLIPAFGPLPARELTTTDVVEWLDWMDSDAWLSWADRAAVLSPASRLGLLGTLGAILGFGLELGAVDTVVTRDVPRRHRPRTGPLERPALEVLDPRSVTLLVGDRRLLPEHRLLWALHLLTGARPGEICGLDQSSLRPAVGLPEIRIDKQLHAHTHKIRATKTERIRHTPAHPIISELVQEVRARMVLVLGGPVPADAPLCPRLTRTSVVRWKPTARRTAWREDLARLGIPDPSTGARRNYAAKHTFATLLRRANVDRDTVHAMTHGVKRSRDGLSHYEHTNWEDRCQAVLALPIDNDLFLALQAEREHPQMELFDE